MTQPSADRMRQMARRGQAMPAPGQDRPGRFPIRNRADLERAIRAVGRAVGPSGSEEDRQAVRKFILKRAQALKALDLIPDTWAADGSLKT